MLRIPFVRCVHTAAKNSFAKIGIVGAALNIGQKLPGVSKGPLAIRGGGLIENVKAFNPFVDVKDFGDVSEALLNMPGSTKMPENMGNYPVFPTTMKLLSDKVLQVLEEDRICWTLGGDHSVAVGMSRLELWLSFESN